MSKRLPPITCSFCGLTQHEASKMLVGMGGVAVICDACVVTGAEMIGRPCRERQIDPASPHEPGKAR
jgi:hypothetical protein